MRRLCLPLLLPLIILSCVGPRAAPAPPGEVGELRFLGALTLRGPDGFGGISAMRWDADGERLVMLSDRGRWFSLRPLIEGGRLAGIADFTADGTLKGLDGRPVAAPMHDAEDMLQTPEGDWLIAFERRHRLWLYPKSLSGTPRPVAAPHGMAGLPYNGGVEAMTILDDGRFWLLAEQAGENGTVLSWIGGPGRWHQLAYRPAPSFAPTAAAALPGGDVVVLERRFSLLAGFAARLVRVAATGLEPGAVVEGRELARLEAPLPTDNFEALAVRPLAAGGAMLFVMSDDNFSALQAGILLAFALNR